MVFSLKVRFAKYFYPRILMHQLLDTELRVLMVATRRVRSR